MLQQAGDTPRAGAVGASHVGTRDTETDKPQGTLVPNAPSYSSIQQLGTRKEEPAAVEWQLPRSCTICQPGGLVAD